MDEAVEAGLLAEAYRRLDGLISSAQAEAYGPLPETQTRWKTLCLEVWGRDHEEDGCQDRIGDDMALPPAFVPRLLGVIKLAIATRLSELGVETT